MSNIYNPYDLEPFEPTHPGELLGDELEDVDLRNESLPKL